MNFLGILLPPGVGRIVAVGFDSVRGGLERFARSADARYACVVLDRLIAILRHIFMLCAVYFEPRAAWSGPGRSRPSLGLASPGPARKRRSRPPCGNHPRFPLVPSIARGFHICDAFGQPIVGQAPPPSPAVRGDMERLRALRCAQLRHGLDHATHCIARLARAMRRDDFVLLVLPAAPMTTPQTDQRDFWEEHVRIAQEARYVVLGFLRHLNAARRARLLDSS
jgi:hypothetical protein